MPSADEAFRVPPEAPAPPPGHALYQMAMGHFVSRARALAAKLGLADLLKDGPRGAHDLAAATQTHAPSLARLARFLVSVGVFAELPDGTFVLTPLGQPLRADTPGSVRALVLLLAGVELQDCWKDLEYCVRTGDPSFRRTAPGADPYTLMARSPELTALFDQAMATFAPWTAVAVAAAIDFSAFERVVDVGGGNGALLIGWRERKSPPRGWQAAAILSPAASSTGCRPGPTPPCSRTCSWTGTTSGRPRSCGTAAPPCPGTGRS